MKRTQMSARNVCHSDQNTPKTLQRDLELRIIKTTPASKAHAAASHNVLSAVLRGNIPESNPKVTKHCHGFSEALSKVGCPRVRKVLCLRRSQVCGTKSMPISNDIRHGGIYQRVSLLHTTAFVPLHTHLQ